MKAMNDWTELSINTNIGGGTFEDFQHTSKCAKKSNETDGSESWSGLKRKFGLRIEINWQRDRLVGTKQWIRIKCNNWNGLKNETKEEADQKLHQEADLKDLRQAEEGKIQWNAKQQQA